MALPDDAVAPADRRAVAGERSDLVETGDRVGGLAAAPTKRPPSSFQQRASPAVDLDARIGVGRPAAVGADIVPASDAAQSRRSRRSGDERQEDQGAKDHGNSRRVARGAVML